MSSGFRTRLTALVRKEFRQLLRDASNMAIGIALPIVLILIFGYGLSLDVKNAPIAIVMEDSSPTAQDAVAGFSLSPSFAPLQVASMHDAEALMRDRRVDAIVRIPATFTRDVAAGAAPASSRTTPAARCSNGMCAAPNAWAAPPVPTPCQPTALPASSNACGTTAPIPAPGTWSPA